MCSTCAVRAGTSCAPQHNHSATLNQAALQSRARPPLPYQNLWRCCTCRSLCWEPVQRMVLLSTAPGVVTARKEVPQLIQAAPSSGASLPPDVHRDFRRHFCRGHRHTEPHQPWHTQTRLPLLPDKDILAPTAP